MEVFRELLLPYKEQVGNLATIVTIGQFFTGIFICRDIYKQKNTKGISSIPFIGAVALGIVLYKYGIILKDEATLIVNGAAILIHLIYLAFYYFYSQEKWEDLCKPMSYAVLIVAMCLSYAEVESKELLEYRYGLLVTVLLLSLMGSPLKDLGKILSSKDASSIPFPLTFVATIVTILWLLYGIILDNTFMVVQNVLGFSICFFQLILIFKFSGSKELKKKIKKKTQ